MLVATVPAQIWIDRWGRRKPLIIGGILMTACFAAIGAIYARFGIKIDGGVRLETKGGQWAVTVLTYVFVANFSWSWAVVSQLFTQCLPVVRTDGTITGRQNIRLRDYPHAAASQGVKCGTSCQLAHQLCCCSYRTSILALFSFWAILSLWRSDIVCVPCLHRYARNKRKKS